MKKKIMAKGLAGLLTLSAFMIMQSNDAYAENQFIKPVPRAYTPQMDSQYKHESEVEKMKMDRELAKINREHSEEKKNLKNDWRQEEALKDEIEAEKRRYFSVCRDSTFTYYMDTMNTQWIRCPFKAEEYIIDVWIRLVENSEVEKIQSGEIAHPTKYYMEHYYLRPDTKQLQFLCELEVSKGRPNNDVAQRPYSPAKWENLIPGSIEDSIYHGVMRNIKKYNLIKRKDGNGDDILGRIHTITSSIAEAAGIYI